MWNGRTLVLCKRRNVTKHSAPDRLTSVRPMVAMRWAKRDRGVAMKVRLLDIACKSRTARMTSYRNRQHRQIAAATIQSPCSATTPSERGKPTPVRVNYWQHLERNPWHLKATFVSNIVSMTRFVLEVRLSKCLKCLRTKGGRVV